LSSRKQRARTLAHDSNNFIYQVDSVLELIVNKALDENSLISLANAIRSRTPFFKTLINEMLSDKPSQIRHDPIDVMLLAENIRKYHRVMLDTKIELVCHADNTQIFSDYLKLSQIINNLLSNAVRFSPPEGQIEIILSSTQTSVEIAIWDEGPGLSPDQTEKVFQERLSPTNGGNGYGLKMVGDLVHQLGGQINYKYEQGAVFTVSLPIN
jgi:signal transduction histidine kinase